MVDARNTAAAAISSAATGRFIGMMPNLPMDDCMFNSSERPVGKVGAVVRLTHIRKCAAGGLAGSIDSVAEPLAPPSIHEEREHLVENVVIEPSTAGALVRLVGEH